MLLRNTDIHARTWPRLVETATGTTLHLEPGATTDVDVPDGFVDPYLEAADPPSEDPEPSSDPVSEPAASEPAAETPKRSRSKE